MKLVCFDSEAIVALDVVAFFKARFDDDLIPISVSFQRASSLKSELLAKGIQDYETLALYYDDPSVSFLTIEALRGLGHPVAVIYRSGIGGHPTARILCGLVELDDYRQVGGRRVEVVAKITYQDSLEIVRPTPLSRT